MCDYINAHEELVNITSLGEYRVAMKKVMRVIKGVHNVERKRRQSSRKKKMVETRTRTQRVKSPIFDVKRGGMIKEVVERQHDEIFGKEAVTR